MQSIYLIRHGQANFGGGADNYDKLSELGHLQAKMLSNYLRENLVCPDVICTGTLQRHKETAHPVINSFISAPIKIHEFSELNEFSPKLWKGLAEILRKKDESLEKDLQALKISQERRQKKSVVYFFKVTNQLLEGWKQGITPEGEESYLSFKSRIHRFVEMLNTFKKDKHILVFSSGTPISVLISHFLGMDASRELDWMYGLYNTSVSLFKGKHFTFKPISINTVPHIPKLEQRTLV